MIDYKLEFYALIGSSILIAGLLRLYLFFKSFNISILPFIELEELTTLALDNILYFSIFIILNLVIVSFFYKNKSEYKKRIKRLKEHGFFKFNKILLLIIVVPILFLLQNNLDKVFFYEFILWVILSFVGIYLNPLIYFEAKNTLKTKQVKVNKLTLVFIISALNLCLFAGASGISEAYKVKSINYYYGSEFKLKDGTKIISNFDEYYIGKSKGFLFFYKPKEEITRIIPVSRIENIELKK